MFSFHNVLQKAHMRKLVLGIFVMQFKPCMCKYIFLYYIGKVSYTLSTSVALQSYLMIQKPTVEDDNAILAVGKDQKEAARNLQSSINQINSQQQWRIRLIETKSAHVNFTMKVSLFLLT